MHLGPSPERISYPHHALLNATQVYGHPSPRLVRCASYPLHDSLNASSHTPTPQPRQRLGIPRTTLTQATYQVLRQFVPSAVQRRPCKDSCRTCARKICVYTCVCFMRAPVIAWEQAVGQALNILLHQRVSRSLSQWTSSKCFWGSGHDRRPETMLRANPYNLKVHFDFPVRPNCFLDPGSAQGNRFV